MSVTISLGLD